LFFSLYSQSSFALAVWDNYQGAQKYKSKDYQGALDNFSNSNQSSDSKDYNYNLGNAYYRLGQFAEAEKHFLQSLEAQNPEIRQKSLYNLGNTKFRQNDLKSAIDYYDKALKIHPGHKEAELNKEFVSRKLKEKEQQQEQKNDESQKQDQNQPEPEKKDEEKPNEPEMKDKQEKEPSQETKTPDQKQEGAPGKNENQEQEGAPGKNENQEQEQVGESTQAKDEVDQKQQQMQRLLESIGDNTERVLQDGIPQESRTKKIDKPY
jgi:Ca-activated chloride channel family protein